MSSLGSVSSWMARLRDGDPDAAQALWERYFLPLVASVKRHLWDVPRAAADEEDVALSAFDSFFRRASQGQFPRLADRHDLWSVLLMVASRKARDLVNHEQRQGRDWRRVEREGEGPETSPFDGVPDRELDPSLSAELADSVRQLFRCLGDDELRAIAQRKLEGFTNEEIAAQIGRSLPTVERRLVLVRECWRAQAGGENRSVEEQSSAP